MADILLAADGSSAQHPIASAPWRGLDYGFMLALMILIGLILNLPAQVVSTLALKIASKEIEI